MAYNSNMPNQYFAEKKALLEQIDILLQLLKWLAICLRTTSFMKQILTSLIYSYEVHVYTI